MLLSRSAAVRRDLAVHGLHGPEEYCGLFSGLPASDDASRSWQCCIDAIDVHGTVATASLTLRHSADGFTDAFLLVHADGGRRNADEVCHRCR
ncbi:nuclear transport factor 2 family protein [Streptomyces sp. NPDC006012]|uniref:nuclear transport factor 2 family protein n=1 Tax=Streptomyces sp. NPDC006012 TaxID=3364739 RepID=UPI0036B9567D